MPEPVTVPPMVRRSGAAVNRDQARIDSGPAHRLAPTLKPEGPSFSYCDRRPRRRAELASRADDQPAVHGQALVGPRQRADPIEGPVASTADLIASEARESPTVSPDITPPAPRPLDCRSLQRDRTFSTAGDISPIKVAPASEINTELASSEIEPEPTLDSPVVDDRAASPAPPRRSRHRNSGHSRSGRDFPAVHRTRNQMPTFDVAGSPRWRSSRR